MGSCAKFSGFPAACNCAKNFEIVQIKIDCLLAPGLAPLWTVAKRPRGSGIFACMPKHGQPPRRRSGRQPTEALLAAENVRLIHENTSLRNEARIEFERSSAACNSLHQSALQRSHAAAGEVGRLERVLLPLNSTSSPLHNPLRCG